MKHNMKRFVVLMFLACLFLFQIQTVFASNTDLKTQNADRTVKSAIQADFANYQKPLDNAKDKFGVNGTDSFANAQLGDGIPYFIVGDISKTNEDFAFDGYIFPIQVKGKPAGIVFANEVNGKWTISNIKSNLTFDQDIQNAKKQLKNTDQTLLVYDPSYGLYSLLVQDATGSKSMIAMMDNDSLKLKKNNAVAFSDFKENIEKMKKDKQLASQNMTIQAGGTGAIDAGSSYQVSTMYLSFGAGVLIIGMIVFFMVRRKKQVA